MSILTALPPRRIAVACCPQPAFSTGVPLPQVPDGLAVTHGVRERLGINRVGLGNAGNVLLELPRFRAGRPA